MNLPDHPAIARAMATGYPEPVREPEIVRCADCGCVLRGEDEVFVWDDTPLCKECCRTSINDNFTTGEIAKALNILAIYAEEFADAS